MPARFFGRRCGTLSHTTATYSTIHSSIPTRHTVWRAPRGPPKACPRARARDERGSEATERIGWGGCGAVIGVRQSRVVSIIPSTPTYRIGWGGCGAVIGARQSQVVSIIPPTPTYRISWGGCGAVIGVRVSQVVLLTQPTSTYGIGFRVAARGVGSADGTETRWVDSPIPVGYRLRDTPMTVTGRRTRPVTAGYYFLPRLLQPVLYVGMGSMNKATRDCRAPITAPHPPQPIHSVGASRRLRLLLAPPRSSLARARGHASRPTRRAPSQMVSLGRITVG